HPHGNARGARGPAALAGLSRLCGPREGHLQFGPGGRLPFQHRGEALPPDPACCGRYRAGAGRRAGCGTGRGGAMSRSYPPDATLTVTVKATAAQKIAWESAAGRHGKASAGGFLAWAGDLYLALQHAYNDTVEAHDDSLEGPGAVERRRREREGRREA